MKRTDIMSELYNIRSLFMASDMATILKEEYGKNSYHGRRWSGSDVSNIVDIATQKLEELIHQIDIDDLKRSKSKFL